MDSVGWTVHQLGTMDHAGLWKMTTMEHAGPWASWAPELLCIILLAAPISVELGRKPESQLQTVQLGRMGLGTPHRMVVEPDPLEGGVFVCLGGFLCFQSLK